MKYRTEWCAEANRYRCMRCGRGSKYMKMPGRCTGPKFLSKSLGKWRRRHLGGHDVVRRMDRQKEVSKNGAENVRVRETTPKKEESQQKRQRIGESREKRKELREGTDFRRKKSPSKRGVQEAVKTILKWKAQRHKEAVEFGKGEK